MDKLNSFSKLKNLVFQYNRNNRKDFISQQAKTYRLIENIYASSAKKLRNKIKHNDYLKNFHKNHVLESYSKMTNKEHLKEKSQIINSTLPTEKCMIFI